MGCKFLFSSIAALQFYAIKFVTESSYFYKTDPANCHMLSMFEPFSQHSIVAKRVRANSDEKFCHQNFLLN